MRERTGVAVVGGGILGLAHAYVLARRGLRVTLFERTPRARGASVRNFGMIWPIGQPKGPMHGMAMRSAEMWRQVLNEARIPFHATGSLHVAHHLDEAAVLREFAEIAPALGYPCQWLEPGEALARGTAVQPESLQGCLWSASELTVDPRATVIALSAHLQALGVEICWNTLVTGISLPAIETSAGTWQADAAVVCGGIDFQTLYPDAFAGSGITLCKLQMLRTAPQPGGWQLGPALAAGLTLRFYPAFQICQSLAPLKQRIASEKPEYDRWAIHVLASQTNNGAVTLGDSHEYGGAIDPFDKTAIDDLILREARTFLRLPTWEIAERWHGVYPLVPGQPFFHATPAAGVHIVTGAGGSGMTLSFGLAESTAAAMGV